MIVDMLAKLLPAGTTVVVKHPDGKSVKIIEGGQPCNDLLTFHGYDSAATVSGLNLKWTRRGSSYVFHSAADEGAAEEVLDLLAAQEESLTQMELPVVPMGVILTPPPVSKSHSICIEGIPSFPIPYAKREEVKQQLRQEWYPALVHERVEMALAFDLEMSDGGTRWFREGVADWMRVRVMRHLLGSANAYFNAYEATFKEERTWPQQPLNLIEWSGANSDALYLAALAQVEEIDRKAGKDWLQRVLRSWALTTYVNRQRLSSAALLAILNDVVGEDIEKRLRSVNFADCLRVIREMRDK